MVIFMARARVRAEALHSVLTACSDMIARTPAESGCISYHGHQVIGDPQTIVFVERWRSREDFNTHMAAAHTQAFLAQVAQSVEAPPSIESFEVADT